MSRTDDGERRRSARFRLAAPITLATRSEHVVLGGRAVNASAVGVLVCFPGPALPINPGDRCLLSHHLTDGVLHVVARVRRKQVGDDDLYYVGMEYETLQAHELSRLSQHACGHPTHTAGGPSGAKRGQNDS